jgi:hypothetical protein
MLFVLTSVFKISVLILFDLFNWNPDASTSLLRTKGFSYDDGK